MTESSQQRITAGARTRAKTNPGLDREDSRGLVSRQNRVREHHSLSRRETSFHQPAGSKMSQESRTDAAPLRMAGPEAEVAPAGRWGDGAGVSARGDFGAYSLSVAVPHLVIFDCDGVLVDSETASNAVLAEALCAAGVAVTAAQARTRYRGMLLEHITVDVQARHGIKLSEEFWATYERDWRSTRR